MKSIIKFIIVFIISFLCFNQGMNDFFDNYIPTSTNIIMIFTPFLSVGLVIIDEVLKQLEHGENKPEDF